MATSNAMSTSNQFVKYTITITQNSQNIIGNTSNVTVSVRFYRTNTGYSTYGTGTLYCKINGTTYSAAVTPSQKITNSGIVLFTKTLDIAHNDDGTKSLTCSAWLDHNSVTASEQSYTQALTTIPRKSTISVANGTLGTAQTITVTRQSSSFTHTIAAICGNASTTICNKSSSTSISFTPPLSWASQNTTGTSLTVKYVINTFSGNTNLGSNTVTKTCTIPASVKPTCTISVSDATSYASTYGVFIKGKSKLHVTVNPTIAYGSNITSYSTTANGSTYSSKSFTTSEIKSSGTLTIKATVKDQRGRTGTASTTVNVVEYIAPTISKLNVKRCNADGVENDGGSYIKVTFSCNSTSLNDNKPTYGLKYKKSTETTWTNADISSYNNQLVINDGQYIFAADTGSSYEITLSITDSFETVMRTTVASTAATIMHFKANGRGISFGKVSEIDNVFDVQFQTRLNGGLLYPLLQNGTDFNAVMTPGFYTVKSIQVSGYSNCPLSNGTATLKVESCGEEGQLRQIVSVCSKTDSIIFERSYYQSAWGSWIKTVDYKGAVLWSGAFYMQASHNIALSEKVSEQTHGIVLIFSRYASGAACNDTFNSFFVPKQLITSHPGCGHSFNLGTDGQFGVFSTKYLYINDDIIKGNDNNTASGTGSSGVTYNNKLFVLRYVIGI